MLNAHSGENVVLVTGGAGYIGSHTAKALFWHGYRPVVFDNLSSGHRQAVQWGEFVHGDVRDRAAVSRAMADHRPVAVIHLAGLSGAELSTNRPDLFYETNVGGTACVLSAMKDNGVSRIVFSSTASVYDQSRAGRELKPLSEDAALGPATPYGETKLIGERMVDAHCSAFGMTGVALRFFDAAGADPDGELGESHDSETHLILLAIDAALGEGRPLTVFGRDFETPDGSSLRDYVHVTDLALAHVAALGGDFAEGCFEALNVGAGKGHSMLEVIAAVDRALRTSSLYLVANRREGDPPCLVVGATRIADRLGWTARDSSLERIVETAAAWRRAGKFGDLDPMVPTHAMGWERTPGAGRRSGGHGSFEPL